MQFFLYNCTIFGVIYNGLDIEVNDLRPAIYTTATTTTTTSTIYSMHSTVSRCQWHRAVILKIQQGETLNTSTPPPPLGTPVVTIA